jgi:hypothetical protein
VEEARALVEVEEKRHESLRAVAASIVTAADEYALALKDDLQELSQKKSSADPEAPKTPPR